MVKDKGFIYFNGCKYYFTPKDLEKLEDSKTYVMFQKYGMLIIKSICSEKSKIVKRGEKIPK